MTKEFTHKIRVYVPDTDYGGVVYHANYLKFMDQARTEWLSSVGLPLSYFAEKKIHFIIRSAEIQYLKPARLDNVIGVRCRIGQMGKSSIDFEHVVLDTKDETCIFCKAIVKVICIDNNLKPTLVPSEIKQKLMGL